MNIIFVVETLIKKVPQYNQSENCLLETKWPLQNYLIVHESKHDLIYNS